MQPRALNRSERGAVQVAALGFKQRAAADREGSLLAEQQRCVADRAQLQQALAKQQLDRAAAAAQVGQSLSGWDFSAHIDKLKLRPLRYVHWRVSYAGR